VLNLLGTIAVSVFGFFFAVGVLLQGRDMITDVWGEAPSRGSWIVFLVGAFFLLLGIGILSAFVLALFGVLPWS
jgi:hypothetical protein